MGPFVYLLLPLIYLLRWPLRLWVKVNMSPSDLGELGLDQSRPICYILPSASFSDRAALWMVCEDFELPMPPASGWYYNKKRKISVVASVDRKGRPSKGLRRLIMRDYNAEPVLPQLVPVSIFWGRSPKRETSLFRILFSDSHQGLGHIRKFLTVLANGRNTLVNFGQPLEGRLLFSGKFSNEEGARMLARVLRVHFRRQRDATLGPPLASRNQLINSLLAQPQVDEIIQEMAQKEGVSLEQVRAKAIDCAREIAADHSNIATGFLHKVLTWLWGRLYSGFDVQNLVRLRKTVHRYDEVIYLPSHRSHMDYLLLPYILYEEGLAPPQIAAGLNLNFWPVGSLLRHCGAFYIRRSFRGNRLYAAIFRAYVDALLHRGQPMKFYLEGGRSRTGRLLEPKTGLLSMAVTSALGQKDSRVAIVPVYIGYDRVMEVGKYFDELRGTSSKKNESMGGLVRSSRKVLKQKYGQVHISFGEPIDIQAHAAQAVPQWQQKAAELGVTDRPDWLTNFVGELGEKVMVNINSTAILSAPSLVTLVLLSSPQKAMAEQELIDTLDLLAQFARVCPYAPDVTVPDASGQQILQQAEPVLRLQRIRHGWGDVITLEARQQILLTYMRNNVMHLFAVPSLIANLFSQGGARTRKEVISAATELYPLLASELFLRWPPTECEKILDTGINGLIECGLLEQNDDGTLRRPKIGTAAFGALTSLGRIVRESLERYAITTTMLVYGYRSQTHTVQRSEFERRCQLMAERMAVLLGRNSPEFFDRKLFKAQLLMLERMGYLERKGGVFEIAGHIQRLSDQALRLLGADVRQAISHLSSGPAFDA